MYSKSKQSKQIYSMVLAVYVSKTKVVREHFAHVLSFQLVNMVYDYEFVTLNPALFDNIVYILHIV